ncbi:MAG: hypothetical protein P4K94_05075 [Terracidiphilus sp.]|nr:hypothetical protein [Terracidiphilus sp.]
MISLAGWMTPTRSVGMAAYLFAAASCSIAWAKSRGTPPRRRLAAILAALEISLFLDMAFNGRWLLHDLLENKAMAENLYAQRVAPQLVALSILAVAAAVGMGLTLHALRGRAGASVAICGAILSLSCWCAEVISLHAVDAIFHAAVGGIMLVSLIWVAGSLMTGLGILWD